MCRLAAYTGPSLRLDRFLLEPDHGLIRQAHAPRETLSATVNADGIGLGWYDDAGHPAVYRSPLPAWADPNLPHLGRSLDRPLWLANVRSATDPLSVGYANTQPFHDACLSYLHNGFVERFGADVRSSIRAWLRPSFEQAISGTTDSEYLFAALRQLRADAPDQALADTVRAWLELVGNWIGSDRALLNFVVSDGRQIVAVRHALAADCPSLYFHPEHPGFAGGALVVSEPFDDQAGWTRIAPSSIAILKPGQDVELATL